MQRKRPGSASANPSRRGRQPSRDTHMNKFPMVLIVSGGRDRYRGGGRSVRPGRVAIKRLIVGSVLTLAALAATAAVASATHSNGDGPKQDFATGTGHRVVFGPPFLPPGVETRTIMHVNAHSGPGGEDARGRFFVKREASALIPGRPDLDYSGRVTCMTVVGNRAVVGGVITHDKLGPVHPLSPLEGRGYLGVYIDNDQVAGDLFDRSNSFPLATPPGRVCPPFTDPTGEFQTGNFIVHDATP